MRLLCKSDFGLYGLIASMPLWLLLHANNEYYGLIAISTSLRFFLEYLFVTFLFAFISYIIFRDRFRVLVFTFVLFACYFLFGAFQDFLRSSFFPAWVSSYKITLPFIACVVLFSLYYLGRKIKHPPVTAFKYVKWLLIIFLLIEVGVFSYYLVFNGSSSNYLASGNIEVKQNYCSTKQPDIFYIVLDEYPSSKSLLEDLGFDNRKIDSLIRQLGYFTSRLSNSNYNVSPYSLAATLHLNYLRPDLDKSPSPEQFVMALHTYAKNKLVPFMIDQGYMIRNYGCFEVQNTEMKTRPYFDEMYQDLVNGSTLPSRFKKDIGWYFSTRHFISGKFRVPGEYTKTKDYHLYRNKYNLDMLVKELTTISTTPRLVLAHIMLPHEPFYLKGDGSFVDDSAIIFNTLSPREGFIGQVQFINRWLKEHLPSTVNTTGRDRVVILQGDHGYRFFEKEEDRHKEFRNLNALYFSDKDYSQLYDGISPVNTFRVVLNKYFCQTLPLLPDTSIYIKN